MKVGLIIVGVLLLIAIVLGGSLITARNQLVTEQEGIHGAWAQVDAALQRRLDLIPNLVETVKGRSLTLKRSDWRSDLGARGDDGRQDAAGSASGQSTTGRGALKDG